VPFGCFIGAVFLWLNCLLICLAQLHFRLAATSYLGELLTEQQLDVCSKNHIFNGQAAPEQGLPFVFTGCPDALGVARNVPVQDLKAGARVVVSNEFKKELRSPTDAKMNACKVSVCCDQIVCIISYIIMHT
jgi:hypothetical protein